MDDRNAARLMIPDQTPRQVERLIRGVVQYLNLEQLTRVVDFARGTNDALGDVELVEERQLNRDERIRAEPAVAPRLRTPAQETPQPRRHDSNCRAKAEQCYAIYNYNGQP